MSENRKKIVIVGGGIAGLSAGIYGKLAGYDVDIYEKNPVVGAVHGVDPQRLPY